MPAHTIVVSAMFDLAGAQQPAHTSGVFVGSDLAGAQGPGLMRCSGTLR